MRCGITHVVMPVSSLQRARHFYGSAVGFTFQSAGPEGVDLEAGGIVLRLVQSSAARIAPLCVRLQVNDLDGFLETLSAHGARPRRGPTKIGDREIQAEALDPDGHRLILWRRLKESELAEPVDLPTVGPWAPEAEELMISLLSEVPEELRDLAREGAVAEAEHLAGPEQTVERTQVVRGFIRASPRLFRDNLHQPLQQHGICIEDYSHDFHC